MTGGVGVRALGSKLALDIYGTKLDQIYGHSNFGQLAPLAKFMAKIGDAINLAQYHKWSKPVYCPKL